MMDGAQIAGWTVVPAIIIIGLVVFLMIFHNPTNPFSLNSSAEEEQQEHDDYCDSWNYDLDNMRAELSGKRQSLGGQLDLDGEIKVLSNQYNLETDRYNAECADTQTNYFDGED